MAYLGTHRPRKTEVASCRKCPWSTGRLLAKHSENAVHIAIIEQQGVALKLLGIMDDLFWQLYPQSSKVTAAKYQKYLLITLSQSAKIAILHRAEVSTEYPQKLSCSVDRIIIAFQGIFSSIILALFIFSLITICSLAILHSLQLAQYLSTKLCTSVDKYP